MKNLILSLLPLFSLSSVAAPVRIGIVDAGLRMDLLQDVKFCSIHDYSLDSETKKGETDIEYSHGTNITGFYGQKLNGKIDYCIVFIKLFSDDELNGKKMIDKRLAAMRIFPALNKLIQEKVAYVNMSYTSDGYDYFEYKALKRLNEAGIIMFVAAGNSKVNLDESCWTFPACYGSMYNKRVIGAVNTRGQRSIFSNFGSFVRFAFEHIYFKGISMRGTSQATAQFGVNWILRHEGN